MNVDYPHDIKELGKLTEEERRHYLPISEEEARKAKGVEEAREILARRLGELETRFELARRKRD